MTAHLLTTVLHSYCRMCFETDASDSFISRRPPQRTVWEPPIFTGTWESEHSFLGCFWKGRCVVNASSLPWFRSQPAAGHLPKPRWWGGLQWALSPWPVQSCHALALPVLWSLCAVLLWSLSKNLHLSLNVAVPIRYLSTFSDDLKKHYFTNISRKLMAPLIRGIFIFFSALGCDFWSEYCFLLLIGKDRGNPI